MYAICPQPPLPKLFRQTYCKQHVRCLALAIRAPLFVRLAALETVVVPTDRTQTVPIASHTNNTWRRRGEQFWHNEIREEKVADVIGAELHFQSVGGSAVGGRHDAGTIDEDVDVFCVRQDFLCRLSYLGLRCEVQ